MTCLHDYKLMHTSKKGSLGTPPRLGVIMFPFLSTDFLIAQNNTKLQNRRAVILHEWLCKNWMYVFQHLDLSPSEEENAECKKKKKGQEF